MVQAHTDPRCELLATLESSCEGAQEAVRKHDPVTTEEMEKRPLDE